MTISQPGLWEESLTRWVHCSQLHLNNFSKHFEPSMLLPSFVLYQCQALVVKLRSIKPACNNLADVQNQLVCLCQLAQRPSSRCHVYTLQFLPTDWFTWPLLQCESESQLSTRRLCVECFRSAAFWKCRSFSINHVTIKCTNLSELKTTLSNHLVNLQPGKRPCRQRCTAFTIGASLLRTTHVCVMRTTSRL